jgi:hypothetical protein
MSFISEQDTFEMQSMMDVVFMAKRLRLEGISLGEKVYHKEAFPKQFFLESLLFLLDKYPYFTIFRASDEEEAKENEMNQREIFTMLSVHLPSSLKHLNGEFKEAIEGAFSSSENGEIDISWTNDTAKITVDGEYCFDDILESIIKELTKYKELEGTT